MNNGKYGLIPGGIARDERGQIRFVNDFDVSQVKRFYLIRNATKSVIRGWRGHKIEQRWFYAVSGSFCIQLVRIDNWESPNRNLPVNEVIVDSQKEQVLHIPPGYASAIRSLDEQSELLVYADYGVDHAPLDNYLWPIDYFSSTIRSQED